MNTETLAERFARLRDLRPDWDGDDAPAIATIAMDKAQAFLERMGPDAYLFSVYPTREGGVQIERDFPDSEGMEFDFHSDGRVTYWLFGPDYNDDDEHELSLDS